MGKNTAFEQGLLIGMQLSTPKKVAGDVIDAIGGKSIKLTNDGIYRTYSVLAFINDKWTLHLPRHFNNSIFTDTLDTEITGTEHILNQPSLTYTTSVS